MSNIVAIVGRPNVGKSTLFNRLVQSKTAIVDETSGVTRDRHYGKSDWNGKEFSIIDTGGYVSNSDDIFEKEIQKQVFLAIEESDIIIFLVDVKNGITDLDDAVAQILRKQNKKVILVANKVDNGQLQYQATEFYKLGLGEVFCISSINGSGTGELLDHLVENLKDDKETIDEDIPKLAIVGRPNVGKSSIINALLNKEQNIVTPIAGTTRDTIHTKYNKFGLNFYLIDTAGLRKKGKVNENIEFYSVMRTVRAIENADICLLIIDATKGVEAQDVNIFRLIERNKKGVVVVINKWDLIEKETNTMEKFKKDALEKLEPFNDISIIFTSAITKQRIIKAFEEANTVYKNKNNKIKTSVLNETLLPEIENYPPPAHKGKYIKIKYITQLHTKNPSFAIFCNLPQYIKAPYRRFIENKLRKHFNFKGVPITIFFRKK